PSCFGQRALESPFAMNIPRSGSLSFATALALLALSAHAQRAAQMPASHASAPAAVHSAPPVMHSAPAPAAISRPSPSIPQVPHVQPASVMPPSSVVRTQTMPSAPRSQPAPFVPTPVRAVPHTFDAGASRAHTNQVNPVASDPMPAATRYLPGSSVHAVDNG